MKNRIPSLSREQLEAELIASRKTMADFDQLKDAYRELEKQQAFSREVFKNISGAYLILDSALQVFAANDAFFNNFRVTKEETFGKPLSQLGNKQWDIPEVKKKLSSPGKDKLLLDNFEVIKHFENLGIKTMCLTAKLLDLSPQENNRKFILLEIEDATERVEIQKQLQESIHRYHELVHSSPFFIAILKGRDLIIEVANEAMLHNWGKGNDVIGKPLIKEVLSEMVEQGMEKIFQNVFDTGEPFHAHEMPLYHEKNGKLELGYFDFVYQPHRNTSGAITGVAVIASDVTSQALLHQQIREDERKFRQMAELIPDKISTANPDWSTYYYNQNWLNYTGMTLEELEGQGWMEIIHPQDLKKVRVEMRKALSQDRDFELEARCRGKDGKYRWHLIRAVQVKDEKGNLKTWISAATEIHKIKEEEKRKEDFLKMVSHELKTPVTSMKGYVQLLLRMLEAGGDINSLPLKPSLERIDSQIGSLTRLISEMLDLSRVESGELNLKKKHFSMTELVKECAQDLKFSSSQIMINIREEEDFMVLGDRDRIGQVIINFITNAIKYSPDDKNIDVKIFRPNDKTGSVSVKDRGIGIKKEHHDKIFKRFYRVSGKNEDTYSGFGIGLFLAKEIIQRHQGKIGVDSEEGKGSVFKFTLPLSQKV
jgi:PAS domain S-box-containing protein